MANETDSWTDVSLLGKLSRSPTDQQAWTEFVRRYGPRIFGWCRNWCLQDSDAQDVTQAVLTKLVRAMVRFEYDPAGRFRSWLKTVTYHAVSDHVAAQRRPGQGSGDTDVLHVLEAVEARNDLVQQLAEEFDQELMDVALIRVAAHIPKQRWAAFRLTAIEGLSGAEAAARLGMKVATVFTAKSKVQKAIQEEVRRLEEVTPS